jgi:hypothetical protein
MKNYFLLLLCCIPFIGKSQSVDPKKSINKINEKFSKVADYKADVAMQFGIPNVKISNINATVLYKNPNKFKMKAKGLFFLPKQNPMQNVMNTLKDTANYQAIYSGKALVNGTNCIIVNIIPIKPMGDLVLGKFWIDDVKNLIWKEIVTLAQSRDQTQLLHRRHMVVIHQKANLLPFRFRQGLNALHDLVFQSLNRLI